MPNWPTEIRARLAPLHLPTYQELAITEEMAQDAEDRHAALIAQGIAPEDAAARILKDLASERVGVRAVRE